MWTLRFVEQSFLWGEGKKIVGTHGFVTPGEAEMAKQILEWCADDESLMNEIKDWENDCFYLRSFYCFTLNSLNDFTFRHIMLDGHFDIEVVEIKTRLSVLNTPRWWKRVKTRRDLLKFMADDIGRE